MAGIVAAAQVKSGNLVAKSDGVTWQNGILSFSKPNRVTFIPIISNCEDAPYITTTHWIKQIGPDYIVVERKALDTGNRTYPPTDFTAVIVSL